jgi:hypothetical protein
VWDESRWLYIDFLIITSIKRAYVKYMKLTQKIRIFPTPEQEAVLWKLSEKCRLIYNFALAERRDAYRTGAQGVNYRTQQNNLPLIKQHLLLTERYTVFL